ncbi:Glutamate-ammonia-ligase adenylyltransferase [Pirellulimonas nuda]|uniref:Glutamate-ammonia-ligase adenylyltransferase n=1 Tax=Pirellulimonas nuda TaxID=2528009 RepID=A0A518D6U3_9BACT|nr:bifunctional [glutamate--ammonia ligase]-adenylyl-L-tyrosine phosphorylase/[glutamate--ammonia-ligase] adenylyltransferase [Pirellulimonas nuda]QDU87181.1 Glutamate-ammonia-ligase adenylyltransferase [Pirellulimonas nuda]
MDVAELRRLLDDRDAARPLLASMGLRRPKAGHACLVRMADARVPLDLIGTLIGQFSRAAPTLADPDMAWNNFERFLSAARSPVSTAALFEREPESLASLLQLFAASQYVSDLLVIDQECFDLLRMTEGRPVSRELLVEELRGDLLAIDDPRDAMAALRQAKRRETIRIAYGDIVRNQSIEVVARQISFLADAIVEAALAFARRALEQKHGVPRRAGGPDDGQPARYCVLALGKLGGIELNYSSDIDLIPFYGLEGQTDSGRGVTNREFFERLTRELIRLLTEPTELGVAYRVDLRLRPEGASAPLCHSFEQMAAYYDSKGRTWERQAMIKARPIAGDIALGDELLARLDRWVYRRYLSLADITGIKALKRRIENRAEGDGRSPVNVKTGQGGIRDIEFVIQFLQLLNGGALPDVRTGNTLEAIRKLAEVGCLTPQERLLLEENYAMLRKLEHRLQMMHDLQTHTLPADDEDLAKVAVRMGYASANGGAPLDAFRADFAERTTVNRRILDHLLHDAFGDDAEIEPEVDLVNDPDPSEQQIVRVLGRYPFEDVETAYVNLMALATERIRFLSTRRCRHFLASIAPRLLQAIARTPEPDATLVNLARVSDSLGGKAALWELFSAHPPSLKLYVMLCAACPYLAETITSSPGMIDELLDSLIVDRLPSQDAIFAALADLTRGAEELDPILHSFKNAYHLRVGVRDLLGKDDVRDTNASLSDIAEACLRQIVDREYRAQVEKFGVPTIVSPPPSTDGEIILDPLGRDLDSRTGETCGLVILALGKLGGREPNYHSDLDLVFLYEAEGRTVPRRRGAGEGTTNGHFFGELGQRIIRAAARMGPQGKLYEIDVRLRPTGRSGSLAVPIDAFLRYYQGGQAQLWERQALCKARVVYGPPAAAGDVMQAVAEAAYGAPWTPESAHEVREMRLRLEETATPRNLKRGRGGTVDTEFVVQMLQLKHGGLDASVRVPGTLEALDALEAAGYLAADDAAFFRDGYRFQRNIEARIRLMNSIGRHELPTDPRELKKLAFLLGYDDPDALEREALRWFEETRARFEKLVGEAAR